MPLVVVDAQAKGCGGFGEYLGRRDYFGGEPFDVAHAGIPGNRHKGQKARHHQKQQVVAGIDGREAQQDGDGDVECPRLADPQAKGSAMSAMSARNNPPMSAVSWSGRMTRRWAQTATAIPLTSSGAT